MRRDELVFKQQTAESAWTAHDNCQAHTAESHLGGTQHRGQDLRLWGSNTQQLGDHQ